MLFVGWCQEPCLNLNKDVRNPRQHIKDQSNHTNNIVFFTGVVVL